MRLIIINFGPLVPILLILNWDIIVTTTCQEVLSMPILQGILLSMLIKSLEKRDFSLSYSKIKSIFGK